MIGGVIESFLRPLYQDLDGVSHFDEVQRIGRLARAFAPASRELELLIAFHRLGRWLEKVGNISRTVLAVPELTEADLRRTAASIARLDAPESDAERAVAAALLVDGAGVRGLAERLSRARREGMTVTDVARAALAEHDEPEWLPPAALSMLRERRAARDRFCEAITLEE